uniref:Uncharacterized protein n=1 Tax=viral metagenome TaxID=1070528 RepID=A0A6C0BJ88_9ZZZZ
MVKYISALNYEGRFDVNSDDIVVVGSRTDINNYIKKTTQNVSKNIGAQKPIQEDIHVLKQSFEVLESFYMNYQYLVYTHFECIQPLF